MGPLCDVVLREALSPQEIEVLGQWLEQISTAVEGTTGNWDFWVYDATPLGAAVNSPEDRGDSGSPLHLGPLRDFSEEFDDQLPAQYLASLSDRERAMYEADRQEERDRATSCLGFFPAQVIPLWAGCNKEIDRVLLGHLALTLAERYDGLIDMGGEIKPPYAMGESEPTPEEISAFVHQMPGKVCEIAFSGSCVVNHLVDTKFMRAWLQHPHFHMIK